VQRPDFMSFSIERALRRSRRRYASCKPAVREPDLRMMGDMCNCRVERIGAMGAAEEECSPTADHEGVLHAFEKAYPTSADHLIGDIIGKVCAAGLFMLKLLNSTPIMWVDGHTYDGRRQGEDNGNGAGIDGYMINPKALTWRRPWQAS